jgi:hypothetical protein
MAKLNAILSFDLDTYAGVSNETLVVDAKTREIYIPDPSNVFGVQYDKDSKYVKFKVMNVVSEVFKMEDAVIRINYRDSKGIIGSSLAVDKVTYYDTCEFSWVVPNNALKNKGDLYFVVSAVIVDDEGIIQKRWATTLSRVVTPESIYIKAASLDQNERDEIAMLLLLVSEKCNQAVEDIREARDTGITTITNVKDSGIEELNDLISKYGIRFEDLNVLKSRIDQLFDSGNLPNANTEVTDIRIGYDGTRYSTAGNAVRIQISNIMGMILDNQFYTPLLIDRDSELIDEENNILQADWQYKVDGNQSLNRDSCDVEVFGNVTYEFEGLINQAKNELNQIKTDTSTLKDEANTSAVNAKTSEDKAKEYADNLQASTEAISKLKEDLVANEKEDAKTKRSLSALWDLNNGISYRFETDSEKAYKKQIPSGAKLGSVNKVGGKTITWNQMFNYQDVHSKTISGVTFTNRGDGTYIVNGTSTEATSISGIINIIKGHMYYMRSLTTIGSPATYRAYITGGSAFNNLIDYGSGAIERALNNGKAYFLLLYIVKGVTVNDLKIVPQVYDLTKMFGYGNEPSTTQEFKAMFPNDYYAYNEGELISMSVNDVIYTDTSSNHVSHPIPQSIQNLDGYGWSAGTTYNYVDFENKKYYKYVDKVDLGTFKEIYLYSGVTPEEGRYVYAINISAIKTKPNSGAICELFDNISSNEIVSKDGMFLNSAYDQLLISTSKCKSLKELKSYINGKYLYYELAEPIVMDISELIGDTFQEPFEVESGGSFTFKNTNGDGYQIAVPSDIQYTVTLSEVNA